MLVGMRLSFFSLFLIECDADAGIGSFVLLLIMINDLILLANST